MAYHTNDATARRLAILASQDAPRADPRICPARPLGAAESDDSPDARQVAPPALTVVVPMLPPSTNHLYVTRRGGGKALTVAAQAFRDEVARAAGDAARSSGWAYPPDARLQLTVKLTFPSNARVDVDNRLKSSIDALALALHFDDSAIDRIVAERLGVVKGRPRCELVLEVMEKDQCS